MYLLKWEEVNGEKITKGRQLFWREDEVLDTLQEYACR